MNKQRLKAGDGLSMNMVVLAILALIMLVVLSITFTGETVRWKKALNDCESKGAKCVAGPSEEACNLQGGTVLSLDCSKKEDICCKLECENQGGQCQEADNGACSNPTKTVYYTNCDRIGKVCCLP